MFRRTPITAFQSTSLLAFQRTPVAMFRRTPMLLGGAERNKAELGVVKYWSLVGWDALIHTYHGFRLLAVNSRVAWSLAKRVRKGQALTRRERVLLENSTADLLRLVPFSVFIILPGGELLLPVALKMFPGMIPSTFESESQGRNRAFGNARATVKAKQRLLEYTTQQIVSSVAPSGDKWERLHNHLDLLRRAGCGDAIPYKMIKEIAPVFAPSGPMHHSKLPVDITKKLAQVMGVYPKYYAFIPSSLTHSMLQKSMSKTWDKLQKDDEMLAKEGLDLTRDELEKACQVRGMRWVDGTEALEDQLQHWINLSLDKEVSYHTLFFFKPTANNLSDSIKSCPTDARQKLLGMQMLPPDLRDQLDKVVKNISAHAPTELEKKETTKAIMRKTQAIFDAAKKSDSDIELTVRRAIADHFPNKEAVFTLYNDIETSHGKVTVSACQDVISGKIGQSSHVVSNVFDALEMGDGSTELTQGDLKAMVLRCREKSSQE